MDSQEGVTEMTSKMGEALGFTMLSLSQVYHDVMFDDESPVLFWAAEGVIVPVFDNQKGDYAWQNLRRRLH